LNVREAGASSLMDLLVSYVQQRELLIVRITVSISWMRVRMLLSNCCMLDRGSRSSPQAEKD
jgi:hypothetical protein